MFKKLFGKNISNTPSEPIFPHENYSIFNLTIDESLAFATINTGYNNYSNKKYFPWYTEVVIEIIDKNVNGHPTNEEAAVLNDLEEKITDFLKETQVVHHIGRVTRNGERDILYYIDEPRLDKNKVKFFFDTINAVRPLNLTLKKVENWDNVAAFIK